jgi:Zn-dependent protease
MNREFLLEGLLNYAYLVVIITFHEFGHAWAAWKCGDDTARSQGRVTLNPIAHLDWLGTVALPLLVVVLGASGSTLGRFIIGWGKPVPVNVNNLRRPRLDDILVAMAGPIMNVLLALAVMIVGRLALLANAMSVVSVCQNLALFSMFLCFFNLLPIPPLDGSYLLKHAIGMSYETFWRLASFGFIVVIIVIQFQPVRKLMTVCTLVSVEVMARLLGFRLLGY